MSVAATIAQSKDTAEALSYWASALGICLAIIAGIAASWTYFRDQKLEHWKSSNELYGQFLDVAIAHPEFYRGCWTDSVSKNKAKASQYSYFVGKFLWTGEQIALGKDYDDEWRDCLKMIMREHVDYLQSSQFALERDGYSREIIRLIDDVCLEQAKQVNTNA
jgi:hypothetical protein